MHAPAYVKDDDLDFQEKKRRADAKVAELLVDYNLPPHPGKNKRGAPSHQNIWLKGLYLVLEEVAWGRCRLPPAELLTGGRSCLISGGDSTEVEMITQA